MFSMEELNEQETRGDQTQSPSMSFTAPKNAHVYDPRLPPPGNLAQKNETSNTQEYDTGYSL